jgi:hypothetical protein
MEQDLADGAVTFDKINITAGGLAGEVLKTDGAGGLFWQAAAGAAQNLSSLTDVDVTTNPPLLGDALAWDGAFWAPQSSIPGNPQNLTLTNLVDVDITQPVQQREVLQYDGVEWVNEKLSVIYVENIQPVAVTGLLDALVDVNVAGATTDQRLAFNGTEWRAVDAANFGSIDNLSDVDTTGKVDGDALVYDGGTLTWGAVTISGLGASNRTTIVQDIPAMLAQSLKVGDMTYVRDGATVGEWEMYLLLTLPGTVIGEWSKIATMDSAETDARTIAGDIDVTTISPVLLGNVSTGSRVTLVSIDVSVAFDGSPVLTVGTDGSPTTNTELVSDSEVDLSAIGTYTVTTDVEYLNASDTDIKAYFAVGGATVGNARVLVTYV